MTMHHAGLAEIVRRDPRYAYEAYEFIFEALKHTQEALGRTPPEGPGGEPGPHHHVTGHELLDGVRVLALREFGGMARTVLHMWGIERTGDFGNIVFNLVAAGLMSKTDQDSLSDFQEAYDLDQALAYHIQLDEDANS
jgi:uncharacterized repeat protein (TIGR04138 family)